MEGRGFGWRLAGQEGAGLEREEREAVGGRGASREAGGESSGRGRRNRRQG